MNYYPFHIGDFSIHTRHLSLMEDLAYRRMLDLYYTTEKPLPGAEQTARLIGMRDYVAEVATVLADFFTEQEGVFVQARVEREIAKFKLMAEGGKRGATKRWAKGSDSPPIAPISPPVSLPNANQEPRTKNQEPKEETPPTPRKRGERISDSWEPGEEGRSFALTLGISGERFNSEAARFADYWSSQPGMKGVKTDWPATWRNWCRNAAERAPPGRTDRPPDRKSVQLQTAALMTGTHRNTVEIIDDSETVIARRLG